MKLLLLIILIQCCFKLTVGQNFDSGKIVSRDGRCLTTENGSTLFKVCNGSDKFQEYDFNFGSWSLPTFVSKGNGSCVGILIWIDKSGNYNLEMGSNEINPEFKPCWSIKNAGNKDEFYLMETYFKICMTTETGSQLDECKEVPSQVFKFVSNNPKDGTKVTYRTDYIPLNKGNFLDAKSINAAPSSYQGLEFSLGGYRMKFDKCNLKVYNPSNVTIWSLFTVNPSYCSPSAYIKIQPDNNLCIYAHEQKKEAIWCSNTHGSGGRYFAFIPPYSYAREFGIVILNENKQMVWGQFGSYPLTNETKNITIPTSK